LLDVRLRFTKLSESRYISHLDLQRVFQRALRQSGADVWYTQGFNPHVYLNFAVPLTLGFESVCESLDLRLAGGEFDFYLAQRLNACLPPGIQVYDAGKPVMKTTEIAWARWIIETAPSKAVVEAVRELPKANAVMVSRRNKDGSFTQSDCRPMIGNISAHRSGEMVYIDATLASGGERSLNPQLLIGRILELAGSEAEHLLVRRIGFLNKTFDIFE